jgi:phosphate transport system permease protein
MSEVALGAEVARRHRSEAAERRLRKRYAAERRFAFYGVAAICVAMGALLLLLVSIVRNGTSAFWQHELTLQVELDRSVLGLGDAVDAAALSSANYQAAIKQSLYRLFPDVTGRRERRSLTSLVSSGAAFELRRQVMADPALLGERVSIQAPLSDEADMYLKGRIDPELPESQRPLGDAELGWLQALQARGAVQTVANWRFLRSGDSREPELAGIWGALVGSALTLAVTLALCFPIGVATAIYLEEFAARNRFTDFIEVNINNLAAVPSIVFGLLGLAVFLNFFGLPRSSPVVGGMVLALMTLPVVIIAARSALMAVPPSIREAALAVGASPWQVVMHHVFPAALPGVLTGTIIGMARALGETAPLLMIGMVAFIVDIPHGFTEPATVLPVQVFLWADAPERAFVEKTSGAILVLLAFLVLMNLTAVLLRNRFERRW